MKINDALDMKGRLTLRLQDRWGNVVREIAADNDIVMKGRDLVAKLFANAGGIPISHIAVGTGDTPVDPATDTKLESEVFRQEIVAIDAARDIIEIEIDNRVKVMVSTELGFADGNEALTEAAIFNGEGEDSVMYNRVVFLPVNKTSDFKLTLVWEILF